MIALEIVLTNQGFDLVICHVHAEELNRVTYYFHQDLIIVIKQIKRFKKTKRF